MELDLCRHLRPEYPLFVAGLADSQLSLRIQVHLADGCAPCAQELAALCDAFHQLGASQGPVDLPAELVEGMVAEITDLEQEQPEPVIVYPATRERPLLWTLVVLCLLMVVAVAFWGRERTHAQRLVEADRDMANMQTDRVLEDYRRLQQLVDDLTNPRVSVVHLAQVSPAQGGGHARVFVNWDQRRITARAVGLEPPPEEQLYTMWWRGLGAEQLIGQLPATAVARGASVQLDIPEGLERSAQLLISVEAQGPVAPESRLGPVVLQGAIEPSEAEAEGEQSPPPAP